ncbi:MAG: TonB-dependent receptor [Candidatus Eremiobacteraeota bacterium]|nr:TonB-dependent receptor [Candidatus Eremiobacteraeota bacterium]MBV8366962.1 TonB-dependent receptor [Candidatus Eremiobacteraeota bacterium]
MLTAISPALPGTTGGIQGRTIDQSNSAPVADAIVTAAAPSQTATTKSEATGHFAFISLAPDTYTLTASKTGFTTITVPGVTVIADQTRTVTLVMPEAVRTLGTVTATGSTALVRPGTTSNVFSVNATTQKAVQSVAGAGSLNQSYGAIATSPGVVYQQGQQGWYQSVIIRGGDIDQTGYEMDGVPTMRVSDSGTLQTLSNLGQAELQVYTGGTPASAEASGIAGYVNQVIRTGTYPGFANLTLGIGSPALYNKAIEEIGGATPDRRWNYYVGFANSAQAFRYSDQNNGASNPLFFFPLFIPPHDGVPCIVAPCIFDGSGSAIFAPGQTYAQATNTDQEAIINVHYGIQHAHDTGRDDVQMLYVYSNLLQNFYSSQNDLGLNVPATLLATYGSSPMTYLDIPYYLGPIYRPPDPTQLTTQLFPNTGTDRMALAPIPQSEREGSQNGMGLFKLQYQKNFNPQSYLRILAADNYGWWFITGPVSANLTFGDQLPDYEVITHNWVGSAVYSRQMNDKNLLNATVSYFTGKLQTYSMGFFDGFMTNLVDPAGNCYDTSGAYSTCFGSSSDPASPPVNRGTGCLTTVGPTLPPCVTNLTPGMPPVGSTAALNGAQWLTTENGANAQVDNVRPDFTAASVTDQWRPNDKTTVSLGLRVQDYKYTIPNMINGYPARAFWFAAFNREFCFSPGVGPGLGLNQAGVDPVTGASLPCPTTATGQTIATPVNLQNYAGGTTSDVEWEPRIAFTEALSANTVIRGSYGRYSRPAPTSYLEFNTVQQDLPAFISGFLSFGFNSPFHLMHPDVSNNYDLSLEQQIPHTDMSFKVTPFLRATQNQIQYVSLNAQGVVDGLNVGQQTSKGVEFTFSKGNFASNGFALLLTATYTNSLIKYNDFSNGLNVIDLLNQYIQNYNAYTSACATATASLNGPCGLEGNGLALPTFPCNATLNPGCVGTVTNPYFNQPLQPLFDRNGSYTTYDQIPAPFNNAIGFATPFETTLVLNYKHDKWSVTPNLTYSTQGKYGSPLVWPGYDPTSCGTPLVGTTANPQNCANFIFIPDKYTNKFDNLGAFNEPQRLTMGLQLEYDFNPHVSTILTFANLIDTCYQHHMPWDSSSTCMYAQLASNLLAPAGNFTNTPPIQLAYPYGNWYNNLEIGQEGQKLPLEATLQVTFKM